MLRAALTAAADAAPGPVRVADIATRADMSPGHVMYYFGSRDRILVETLLHAESELATRRDRVMSGSPSPLEGLAALVRLYLPTGRSDARWKLWTQLLADPPRDPETLAAFAGLIDSWSGALAEVVSTGVRHGDFRCADPATFAYRGCRLMDGYALEVLLGARGRSRRWAIEEVLATFGDSLSAPIE